MIKNDSTFAFQIVKSCGTEISKILVVTTGEHPKVYTIRILLATKDHKYFLYPKLLPYANNLNAECLGYCNGFWESLREPKAINDIPFIMQHRIEYISFLTPFVGGNITMLKITPSERTWKYIKEREGTSKQ